MSSTFIGGHNDGSHLDVPEGETIELYWPDHEQLCVVAPKQTERYRRERLIVDQRERIFYVAMEVPLLNAIDRLLSCYHPIAKDLEQENRELRTLLAIAHGGAFLYCSDGELQDNRVAPMIDFKRDPVEEITRKLLQRADDRLKANVRNTP